MAGAGGSPLEQAAGVGTRDGTIVLVMGHGATKTQWIPLAERFASKGFYVITFDNRGAGCTTVPGQDSFGATHRNTSNHHTADSVATALYQCDSACTWTDSV